jgi:hypothetical protein
LLLATDKIGRGEWQRAVTPLDLSEQINLQVDAFENYRTLRLAEQDCAVWWCGLGATC